MTRSDTFFPLTPALSPRERENRIQSLEEFKRYRWPKERATGHPLPEGEGWGEGEESVRSKPADQNRQAYKKQRKLPHSRTLARPALPDHD